MTSFEGGTPSAETDDLVDGAAAADNGADGGHRAAEATTSVDVSTPDPATETVDAVTDESVEGTDEASAESDSPATRLRKTRRPPL